MSARLASRIIVVTGGFGILGRAVAERLSEEGARVVLLDRAAAPASGLPQAADHALVVEALEAFLGVPTTS